MVAGTTSYGPFFSSLYVTENVATYFFDFDSALVAVGGTLGLLLG